DFGLAHVEQDLQLTMPGTVLGSLRYMSPEQLEPQRQTIDERCDIYGLGATLYEMLTLRPAVAGKERHQVLNNLLQREVPSPRKFNPRIPKDLETIVRKALEPDRKDRYASAADMAADLRAFLEHRPIAAQPNSLLRQLVAWGRRNPMVALLSLALLILLIVSSLSASLVAYRMNRLADERAGLLQQAETERASAEALADFLIKAFRSPDPSMDGRNFTVAEMLDSASEELLTDKTLDEVAQGDLLDAIGQSLRGLGAFEEAERVHQACFDLRKSVLGPAAIPTLQSMTRLALAKRDLSNLSDSIAVYEEALGLLRQHHGDDDPNTLEAIGALAMAYQDDAQLEKAAPLQKESLERRQRVLGEKDPATLQAMNNMGLWLQENNRHEEACEIYQHAYRLRAEVLTKRHPDTLQSMANLSGALQDLGRLEEALELQEESLELHREVLGEKHPNTLISMNNTALLYADLDRMDECVELFEEVLSSMREKLSDTHQDTLITMGNLAYFYHLAGRMDKAIALAEERLAGETQNRGAEHVAVASSHSMLGTFHFANKNYAKAEEHLRASLAIRRAQGVDDWTTYRDQNKLGEILVATKKYQEAEPLLLESHQQLVAQSEQIPATARERILAESAARLAAYFEAVDLPEKAEEYRQPAVQDDSQ
ncbi:MAG: tetratricopeptide repeat-containing serine/threonine-protein kinase, partial [bacterium]|nr:tetratricopeptide repeat-containing serine/threonine-protein kinase [bacterium]